MIPPIPYGNYLLLLQMITLYWQWQIANRRHNSYRQLTDILNLYQMSLTIIVNWLHMIQLIRRYIILSNQRARRLCKPYMLLELLAGYRCFNFVRLRFKTQLSLLKIYIFEYFIDLQFWLRMFGLIWWETGITSFGLLGKLQEHWWTLLLRFKMHSSMKTGVVGLRHSILGIRLKFQCFHSNLLNISFLSISNVIYFISGITHIDLVTPVSFFNTSVNGIWNSHFMHTSLCSQVVETSAFLPCA